MEPMVSSHLICVAQGKGEKRAEEVEGEGGSWAGRRGEWQGGIQSLAEQQGLLPPSHALRLRLGDELGGEG